MKSLRVRLFALGPALLLCLSLLYPLPAEARDITVQDAVSLLEHPPADLVIIDVRTPAEYRRGHLPGAVNMDYFGGSFESQVLSIPRSNPVLLYCRTGNRSSSAYETMKKAGIATIYHMNEGISAWQAADLPLEK